MRTKGKFVVIDGINGSGKTTAALALNRWFGEIGLRSMYVREPGATAVGEAIREIVTTLEEPMNPVTEVMLFSAARSHMIDRVIRPLLEGGVWVVCDRFSPSTYAYQGFGGGVDLGLIAEMTDAAVGGFHPDLSIILDLPVSVARSRAMNNDRATGGKQDRFEERGATFMQTVRDGFITLATIDPATIKIVSTRGSSVETNRKIRELVGNILMSTEELT